MTDVDSGKSTSQGLTGYVGNDSIVLGNDDTDGVFRSRLNSEAEAGECWRSAVRLTSASTSGTCFFKPDMEKIGVA